MHVHLKYYIKFLITMYGPKAIIRNWIETYIDNILKEPEKTEKAVKFVLADMGIEPNIETVLSYIIGVNIGSISGMADLMEELDKEDTTIEFLPLNKRRMYEIKDTMIKLRFEQ